MSLIKFVEALGINKLIQTITFSNDTGTVNVFTVTGDVLVRIIPVITTNVASTAGPPVANVRLGVVGNTAAFVVDSVSTDLDARGIWVDQTPTYEAEPTDRLRDYIITDGNDVVLTLDAQVDSGVIVFYCFWTPLSVGATVANA